MSGTRGLLEAAEAAAAVVLNRCGKVLNLPTSPKLPPPNLKDEVLRTKPVVVEMFGFAMELVAAETDVVVVFSAS